MTRRQQEDVERCMFCGCIEDEACPGGCGWAVADVCTACVEIAAALGKLLQRKARDGMAPPELGRMVLLHLRIRHRTLLDRWALELADVDREIDRPAPRRKVPPRPTRANPRKLSFPISHTRPRRNGLGKRQGGRRGAD